jgi:hypothetical protein
LDFWFPDVTTAPAFVRWKFVLHFETRQKVKHGFNGGENLKTRKKWGVLEMGDPKLALSILKWSDLEDFEVSHRLHADRNPRRFVHQSIFFLLLGLYDSCSAAICTLIFLHFPI